MRVCRWSDDRTNFVYYEVWHDESQFEAQRETPYRVVWTLSGFLYCHGCQTGECVHTQAVKGTLERG